jgi:predicted anti-sigma-YlaC factor YlaD
MVMRHLSDQQIQNYLDREPSQKRAEIERHLSACPACRNQLAAYKRLYRELGDETGFMLSANFADAVIARVERGSEKKFHLLETVLLILAVIVSLGAALYFTDLGNMFLNLFRSGSAGVGHVFENLPILKGSNVHILVFAALILTAIGLLDKMIFQIRHR